MSEDENSPFGRTALILRTCRNCTEVLNHPCHRILARVQNDDTILHWAAGYGAVKLVRLLIHIGVDVNASRAGERPLHWAAKFDAPIEISRLLLRQGADVNAVSLNGWTPLHEAVVRWNLPVVKFLLRHKADISIKDRLGYTPAEWAAIKFYPDIVVELLRKGARIDHCKARASLARAQAEGWLTTGPDDRLRLTPKAVAALQGQQVEQAAAPSPASSKSSVPKRET